MARNDERVGHGHDVATTDITIAPDGRVFIFGLSADVLEVAAKLNPSDGALQRRLEHMRRCKAPPPSTAKGAGT
jgi:hypothetical protein